MRYLVSFLWIILFFTSCKDDGIPMEPKVSIFFPSENQDIYLPDALEFEFKAESEKSMNSIRVEIVNNNLIPLTQSNIYYPDDVIYNANSSLIFDTTGLNNQILVPPYYFKIRIETNDNSFFFYRKVNLIPRDKEYIGFVTISQQSYNSMIVELYDEKNMLTKSIELDGEFSDSEISNEGELFVSANYENKTYAISLNDEEITWEINGQLPYPEINKLKLVDNIIYQSEGIGRIIGIQKNTGVIKLTSLVHADTVPKLLGISDNYIISDYTLRNNNKAGWYSYYKPSGNRYSRFEHDFITKAIFTNNDKALIFCNSIDKAHVIDFDIVTNMIISNNELPGVIIDHTCRVNNNLFIITKENTVYQYESGSFPVMIYMAANPIIDIKYNDTASSLFLLHNNSVTIINLNGDVIEKKSLNNNLVSIELLYVH